MQIPRRDVDFEIDPASVPRDWCNNDGFETTFLNALSMLFPEGERFFVESVKQQKHKITDPELQQAIVGFIGQEAMHGKEHRAFNVLAATHGYTEGARIEKRLKWFLKRVRKTLSPMSQLAVTCALEHFTAMLAEQLLKAEYMHDAMHPEVQPLWLWHALEESEHKAVAFDVYRGAGGGYVRRVAIMLLTTAVFFAVQTVVHMRLLATRGILWKPWAWARGLTRMYIYPGFFTRLVPAYVSYFRPGFHPDDRDTRALLASWRDTMFGPGGTLEDRTRVIA
ncbi:MAG TPA: metal-dependent hydrolase [Kofleriaceae bacterium]|nr:metal-dependent hydrolase [Kofleriaceae bacterium]